MATWNAAEEKERFRRGYDRAVLFGRDDSGGIGHLTSRGHAVVFEHAERGTVTDEVVCSFADEDFRIQTEHELLWPQVPPPARRRTSPR